MRMEIIKRGFYLAIGGCFGLIAFTLAVPLSLYVLGLLIGKA